MANKTIKNSFSVRKAAKPRVDKELKKHDIAPSTSTAFDQDMETLRNFDLMMEYGPCTGISRLDRWERAEKHSMNPPLEVKALLVKNLGSKIYTESIWKNYLL